MQNRGGTQAHAHRKRNKLDKEERRRKFEQNAKQVTKSKDKRVESNVGFINSMYKDRIRKRCSSEQNL
eukprot:9719324-Heterocapsa_arctica.AAC.1